MPIKKQKSDWDAYTERNKRINQDFEQAGTRKAAFKMLSGGALIGGADLFNKKIARLKFVPTKITHAVRLGGLALTTAGIIGGYRAAKRLKTKEARASYNPAAAAVLLPWAGASLGAGLAGATLFKLNNVARGARTNRAVAKAARAKVPKLRSYSLKNSGSIMWRKIRGRIIPIRMKDLNK